LNEDDEDGNSDEDERSSASKAPALHSGNYSRDAGRAGPRDQSYGGRRAGARGVRGFELDMDAATLLGRRNKRAIHPTSPLSRKPMSSPLKMDGLHMNEV